MPESIPGPPTRWFGLPLMRRLRREPLQLLTEMGQQYGDLAAFRMPGVRGCLVNRPEWIHQILVDKRQQFRKVPWLLNPLRRIDGNGLVLSEGDFWRRQRRLVQKAFQTSRMQRYAQVMVEVTLNTLREWPTDREWNIAAEMTNLTARIIAQAMFDVDLTRDAPRLVEAVHILSEVITAEMGNPFRLPDWLPTAEKRRKRWALGTLDDMIRNLIRQRQASGRDHGDFLSMLLLAVDEEGGGGMTAEQARDEAMVAFNAGHDTSAAGLAWFWRMVTTHPAVLERLIAEVDEVLGSRPATFDDLPRLAFTEMAVKEALRLYPPTWILFIREATDDVRLGEAVFPKGTWAYLSPFVTHRDPRYFPDPLVYDPERFSPERIEQIPEWAYFPFGGGPHVCIGAGFASMEMVLIAATVLQQFRPAIASGQGPIELEPFISLRPRGGLQLRMTRRGKTMLSTGDAPSGADANPNPASPPR